MKKILRLAAVGCVLLNSSLCLADATPSAKAAVATPIRLTTTAAIEKVWNSPQVNRLIKKFIRRSDEFKKHYDENVMDPKFWPYAGRYWDNFQDAKRQIYDDHSPYGDCAVVQLSAWCPDASFGEEMDWSITNRGKRMLPILTYALDHPLIMPDGYKSGCWDRYIKEVTEYVKNGDIRGFGLDE